MADILKCDNDKCKLKDDCYRYTATMNLIYQGYMRYPDKDCEKKDYEMYWKNK